MSVSVLSALHKSGLFQGKMAQALSAYPHESAKEIALQEHYSKQSAAPDWAHWQALLKQHFGGPLYQDWFQDLRFLRSDSHVLVLSAPSSFAKAWIETHYLDLMKNLLCRQLAGCTDVKLELQAQTQEILPLQEAFFQDQSGQEETNIQGAPLDARFTFDHFVVGSPNEFAYAAALRVAESEEIIYNPLFLYGPVGHGKTHLMHSIGHAILQKFQGRKKILYLSAEKFMYYFIRALRHKSVMAFKERFRSVDVLIVDDVQFMSGKDSTQEEFFHTFNALVDQGHQVIISADKPPSDLGGLQERMKSRLGWGLVADLHPTDYALRVDILMRKAAQHGSVISQEILDFLAMNISSSVRELEGALTRVLAHATLVGRSLTLELVQTILRDLLRPHDRTPSLETIEHCVAEHFCISVPDLHSSKRSKAIVRPRQIAMFLMKQLTSASLPILGRHFGGRNHTTVLHAVSSIENLMQRDRSLQEDILALRKELESF